jgi:hypothetical protein
MILSVSRTNIEGDTVKGKKRVKRKSYAVA